MRPTSTRGARSCLAATILLALVPGPIAATGEPPGITLELVDADVRDALRMVSRQGGMNLVMSSNVRGSITLDLRDVTFEETLDAIVKVGGLEYEIDGNIVTVSTREELAARPLPEPRAVVLKLNYVDADRVLPVVEKLLSDRGTAALLQTSDHVARENERAFARTTRNVRNAQNSQNSQNAADALRIGTVLSSGSQGQPARSHTIIVSDVPAHLERIRAVVASIDRKPLQILIEARFVEVSLDDENKLGIDWSVIAKFNGAAAPTTFPFGDSSLGSFNPYVDGGSPGGVFPNAPNSVSTQGAAGLFTFGALDFTEFAAVLEMIQRNTNVQVVSNPHIVVRDRHTATILVGERFPIFSTNVSDFGTVTEQLDRYEPIGVQLEVTPSVLNDDEIQLLVRPSISSLGGTVEGSTGLQAVRINTRQVDTSVTARDGQTIVLGGLFTTREAETVQQVPLLGSIPVLGHLFRRTVKTAEKVDLVIFLTVTLLREDGLTEGDRALFERTSAEADRGARPVPKPSPLAFVPSPPLH